MNATILNDEDSKLIGVRCKNRCTREEVAEPGEEESATGVTVDGTLDVEAFMGIGGIEHREEAEGRGKNDDIHGGLAGHSE